MSATWDPAEARRLVEGSRVVTDIIETVPRRMTIDMANQLESAQAEIAALEDRAQDYMTVLDGTFDGDWPLSRERVALAVEVQKLRVEIERLTATLAAERAQANEWLTQLTDAHNQIRRLTTERNQALQEANTDWKMMNEIRKDHEEWRQGYYKIQRELEQLRIVSRLETR